MEMTQETALAKLNKTLSEMGTNLKGGDRDLALYLRQEYFRAYGRKRPEKLEFVRTSALKGCDYEVETEIGTVQVSRCAGGWYACKEEDYSYGRWHNSSGHSSSRIKALEVYIEVFTGQRVPLLGLAKPLSAGV